MTRQIDLEFRREGNLFIVVPYTEDGRTWLDEHIAEDALQWGGGVVVEWRYVEDILVGAQDDGLRVG